MIAAIFGALAVGLSPGLPGSGESVLTVPVLVYLLQQPAKLAIAGSLAIVGAIALTGAARHARQSAPRCMSRTRLARDRQENQVPLRSDIIDFAIDNGQG